MTDEDFDLLRRADDFDWQCEDGRVLAHELCYRIELMIEERALLRDLLGSAVRLIEALTDPEHVSKRRQPSGVIGRDDVLYDWRRGEYFLARNILRRIEEALK